MSYSSMVTISKFLNNTVPTTIQPHTIRPYTRPRSTETIGVLCKSLLLLLTLIKFTILLYPIVILLLICPPMQRRILYGNRGHGVLRSSSTADNALDDPEGQGFLRNQVTSHHITTSDGETLYSWLIMPMGAYTKNEVTLTKSWSVDEAREIALQILRSDSKAVLAIYLHGSGNHLATRWRCEAYRNLSSGSPDHLYVLTFDYRGFGRSSGSPTEEGLIIDTVSVLSWVEKKLDIPRGRVLLVGHSLGAPVAVAAVGRVMEKNQYAEFAGLILCSGFTDVPKLAVSYKIGKVLPVVKPLTWFKTGRGWVEEKLVTDCWRTEQRLKDLVKQSEVIRLSIMHAQDDDRVPYAMSDVLYQDCMNEMEKTGSFTETKMDLGALGTVQEVKTGGKLIRKTMLKRGGHNDYMSWHIVSFEATRMLKMTGAVG